MQLGLPFGMRYQYVKSISLVGPVKSFLNFFSLSMNLMILIFLNRNESILERDNHQPFRLLVGARSKYVPYLITKQIGRAL